MISAVIFSAVRSRLVGISNSYLGQQPGPIFHWRTGVPRPRAEVPELQDIRVSRGSSVWPRTQQYHAKAIELLLRGPVQSCRCIIRRRLRKIKTRWSPESSSSRVRRSDSRKARRHSMTTFGTNTRACSINFSARRYGGLVMMQQHPAGASCSIRKSMRGVESAQPQSFRSVATTSCPASRSTLTIAPSPQAGSHTRCGGR
jgi:hypothetical protein